MNLSNRIYALLRAVRNEIEPLETADLVSNGCSYRSYLKLIEEVQDEDRATTPEELLLLDTGKNFRKRFTSYMRGAFGDQYKEPEEAHKGLVQVRYEGTLNGDPVFLELIPSRRYKNGVMDTSMKNLLAARSFLLGADRYYCVVMDRNTQGWNAWSVSGDFSELGKLVLDQIKWIEGVVEGRNPGIGFSSECPKCPYEGVCDVEKLHESPEPLPRVKFEVINDASLIKELENYLWSLNNKKNGRKRGVIHPSEFTGVAAGKQCDRFIYYGLLGTEEKRKIDPQLFKIFHVGHASHDTIQTALLFELGEENCECEVKISHDDLKIAGSCDLKLPGQAGEIKTISTKGFSSLSSPKGDHQNQATIYARAPQIDRQEIVYLYLNKDTGEIKEFTTKVSTRRWHKLALRASRIVKAASEGIIPDRINKAYICRSCKYRWTCKPSIEEKRRFT